jgi:cardiolipin synthase
MDFYVRGPVLADMQKAFFATWMERGREVSQAELQALTDSTEARSFADGVNVRFITHRPIEDKDDNVTKAWVHLIDAAHDSIVIETPYFSPSPELLRALKRAAGRRVKVVVLTSAYDAVEFKLAYFNNRSYYRELLEAGVQIYERAPMVHAKVMALDDKVVCGGSPNMNGRSRYRDSESMIIVNDPTLTKHVRLTVESVIDDAIAIKLEDVAYPALGIRVAQSVGRAFGKNF